MAEYCHLLKVMGSPYFMMTDYNSLVSRTSSEVLKAKSEDTAPCVLCLQLPLLCRLHGADSACTDTLRRRQGPPSCKTPNPALHTMCRLQTPHRCPCILCVLSAVLSTCSLRPAALTVVQRNQPNTAALSLKYWKNYFHRSVLFPLPYLQLSLFFFPLCILSLSMICSSFSLEEVMSTFGINYCQATGCLSWVWALPQWT